LLFKGFSQEDFDIFDLQGYQARMPRLRSEITPKLKELAAILTPKLIADTGLELYPHVALHMRRTVNPPEETWAAFARNARAYKPFVHFRVAVNRNGMKVVCFVEDDADDKPVFAANLKKHPTAVAKYLVEHPEVHSFDLMDAEGRPRSGIDRKTIATFADRLASVKGQHASFGIPIGKSDPRLNSADGQVQCAIDCVKTMLPFYQMGLRRGAKW
jgi:uncharacterized protein YktB (UPF0637 family)